MLEISIVIQSKTGMDHRIVNPQYCSERRDWGKTCWTSHNKIFVRCNEKRKIRKLQVQVGHPHGKN